MSIENNNETVQINLGIPVRTLRDMIQEELAKSGTQQAAAIKVTFPDGTTKVVTSDADPLYNQSFSVEEAPKLEKINSATAGC